MVTGCYGKVAASVSASKFSQQTVYKNYGAGLPYVIPQSALWNRTPGTMPVIFLSRDMSRFAEEGAKSMHAGNPGALTPDI